MKFDIDKYKGNFVMHCKTVEEAESFCNYLSEHGRRWCDGCSYKLITEWYTCCEDTVYYFNEGLVNRIDLVHNNYTILEWEDFMKHTFTKAGLKAGDIIQQRNGATRIIMKYGDDNHGVLVGRSDTTNLDDYREDLSHNSDKHFDIVAIRRPTKAKDVCFQAFRYYYGALIYEREEVEEMTLAEVCKLLGKNIKIIK